MKIIIIEDEELVAEDLRDTLQDIVPEAEIAAMLPSVADVLQYLRQHPAPDLIFSDIQLRDGQSFEIFGTLPGLQVPVIFCTAYDEYALAAFRANGIDYLLKPFTRESVAGAIDKYRRLTHGREQPQPYWQKWEQLIQSIQPTPTLPSSLLVHHKGKIIPIALAQVALFAIHDDNVYLTTLDEKTFVAGKKLDELEGLVGPAFFRASRQHLVHAKAIVDVESYLGRRLLLNLRVPVREQVMVSREKAAMFLTWLAQYR